jgi:GNAT superfamily N-acetyltransferase
MEMEIRRFGPEQAGDVEAALEIQNAAGAVDSPWDPPFPPRRFDALLRMGWDGEPPVAYLAVVAGRPVATGMTFTSERDNTHLAWLRLTVHPECRQRGYGSRLFEHLVEEVRAAGRTSVGTDGWDTDRTRAFAKKFGLEVKSQAIQRRQHLKEIDVADIRRHYDEAAAVATDYELLRLPGRTPPALVDTVVEVSRAINDAPTDDLDIEDEVFSAERLAAYEEASAARGNRDYRVIARHRRTGEAAGHTAVGVESDRPTVAHQGDTAVVRAHRGHRLGMLLKTDMLLWLAEVEPQIETLDTWNAESNDHMIAVNEALGYRVMGRELQLQMSV